MVTFILFILTSILIFIQFLQEYEFPSSFTANERQFVANYCSQLGLKTKSRRYCK